jgi:hypothetical protein
MNDAPETTFEEIKLSPKKAPARLTAAGGSDLAQCAEGEQLKQQYDSTIEEWRKQSPPQVRPFLVGEARARQAFELRAAPIPSESKGA